MKNFDSQSPNFIARVLIFILSIFTLFGIQLPEAPEAISTNIINALSSGGYFALISIIGISVIMPVVNFVKSKPMLDFKSAVLSLVGSPNFWIYLGNFVFGMIILYGIEIPAKTAEQLTGAIYSKDWTSMLVIAITNIFDPIVRYLRDKKNQLI